MNPEERRRICEEMQASLRAAAREFSDELRRDLQTLGDMLAAEIELIRREIREDAAP
jgi:hypothetical protein